MSLEDNIQYQINHHQKQLDEYWELLEFVQNTPNAEEILRKYHSIARPVLSR